MKNLFALMLLVTAMAVAGCGEKKKPAPATTPPAPAVEKPADATATPPVTETK